MPTTPASKPLQNIAERGRAPDVSGPPSAKSSHALECREASWSPDVSGVLWRFPIHREHAESGTASRTLTRQIGTVLN